LHKLKIFITMNNTIVYLLTQYDDIEDIINDFISGYTEDVTSMKIIDCDRSGISIDIDGIKSSNLDRLRTPLEVIESFLMTTLIRNINLQDEYPFTLSIDGLFTFRVTFCK